MQFNGTYQMVLVLFKNTDILAYDCWPLSGLLGFNFVLELKRPLAINWS